ncbi:lysophospholipase L1-like esterase [Arthrobacter sp. GAS37]|uniref:SGNH/GDSL hydrolase family protein n=1 Tax=Arthrobacter sp. GAS37 TaxID=3156261 RepID=UPI003835112A
MSYIFTAAVAYDPASNKPVKNASFQVYATADTAFTTPLAITDTFGTPLPGNILNSGTQGVFPQFMQATQATVTIADSTKTYAWTIIAIQPPTQDSAVAGFVSGAGSTPGAIDTLVGQKVNATASTTRGALDGNYSKLSASISTAVTRKNPFDPKASAYNATAQNMLKARAKLGAALSGTGTCSVLCGPGDSLTEGYKGLPASQSYPVTLRKILSNRGYPLAGSGMVFTAQNDAISPDARWAFTNFTQFSAQDLFVQASVSGAVATYTPLAGDPAGTSVDVWFLTGSGAVTISIDGGAAVAFTPPAGAAGPTVRTFSGLANTTHMVAVTTTTATATYFCGVRTYGGNGVEVTNAGIAGSQTSNWLNNAAYNPKNLVPGILAPDIVFLCLLQNDAAASVALATYRANINSLISQYQTLGSTVILVIPPACNTGTVSTTAWKGYADSMFDSAEASNCPVLDVNDRIGAYAGGNPNGLYNGDGVHQTPAGMALWASQAAALLTS